MLGYALFMLGCALMVPLVARVLPWHDDHTPGDEL